MNFLLNKFGLKNRIALVTGGGQGIGAALALALGQAGATILVLDKDIKTAQITSDHLKKNSISAMAIQADVTKKHELIEAFQLIESTYGGLDIAVNNAGIGENSAAEETAEAVWDAIYDVNVKGLFYCCQLEASVMFKKHFGVIINIASMSSVTIPYPQKQAAYNSSKAAVVQLTKSLASEWADRGVRVNCLSPGIVNTRLINTSALETLKAQWIKQNPMKRLATTDDLVGATIFLASEASQYVTGHNLLVDGGHTLS